MTLSIKRRGKAGTLTLGTCTCLPGKRSFHLVCRNHHGCHPMAPFCVLSPDKRVGDSPVHRHRLGQPIPLPLASFCV